MYPSRESFPLMDKNDNSIYSDIVTADLFNNAFVQNFSTDPYIAPTPSFANGFSINITTEIILKHLRQLFCSAAAPDVINNVFLRGAASVLVHPLTVIFQCSIFEAKIPDAWRVAKVLPLYKGKGLECDPNSYRPISITSCACKLLEQIVKDLSTTYFSSKNALSHIQHEFRPKRSTVSNLLSTESYIINAIKNDILIDMILLDFSRAFDKVPHNNLIDAIGLFDFSYRLIYWFVNFLQCRSQYVSINYSVSSTKSIKSGVIQGSVIGPFLFSLFINTLPTVLSYSKFLLFADDSKLIGYVVNYGYQRITEDLCQVVL